tara:strand:+ start:257 stop:463 length:207 start_codon:yes stop_codon:yes gene_type:complete
MTKFEIIARWIHSESTEPISEIEWLLKSKFNSDENKLSESYDDVLKEKCDCGDGNGVLKEHCDCEEDK